MGPLWLVVPTYNEADTLPSLVAGVAPRLAQITREDWRILVVDDASPDGTGALAEQLSEQHEGRIEVLHRPGKAGIGPAYRAGFAHALTGGAEVVVQMDADLSHDPADVPRLVAALDRADMVLGSRYVRGGRVEDWGPGRRLVSRGGCLYAQAILGVEVRDLTGGFKAHRRAVLEGIQLPSIRAEGYAFQIDVTHRALQAGFRVEEVPITFRDRRQGQSKMSTRIAIEAAWRVPGLRTWRPTP